jgi:hypothetical protein
VNVEPARSATCDLQGSVSAVTEAAGVCVPCMPDNGKVGPVNSWLYSKLFGSWSKGSL